MHDPINEDFASADLENARAEIVDFADITDAEAQLLCSYLGAIIIRLLDYPERFHIPRTSFPGIRKKSDRI